MMLGIPVRYFLKHPVTSLADVAADPLQLWMTIQDEYAAKREGSRLSMNMSLTLIGNSDFMNL